MNVSAAQLIPWLPALAAALCGLCCVKRSLRPVAAPIAVVSIFAGFVIALLVKGQVVGKAPVTVTMFEWIHIAGLKVNFAYYLDSLTLVMLFVVCGIGTLVAVYASGYMKGDRGYARFFAGVCLFIFAMTTLVMADNLVLLYLGWEGVGLCSYLLIGFYYKKPSAVAAAKKAFIVNRIGDLGFALGIFLTFVEFGTVQFGGEGGLMAILATRQAEHANLAVQVIPFLLMLGAFGKSAQLPLYVWLPDAMEGPTPVSALIHAATMVTAGVYMIARLLPLFVLSPYALPTVAVVGGATAIFAATIAMCQYDIKRIYAYSTVSQLGYMFLGVGALTTTGAVFHLFTHAFFKALLFLTAGSVMHALAGQLDLRKMSGLRHRMPVTCWLMFLGCLALAGFPFTAGFYSKDMILAEVMGRGLGAHGSPLFLLLALVGLFTALLTAFYTFRLWFRVFMGPEHFVMGDEHHEEEGSGHVEEGNAALSSAHSATSHHEHHHHEPHEMPWLMNGPLVILAIGAVAAGFLGHDWMERMIAGSSANVAAVVSHAADHGAHAAAAVEAVHAAAAIEPVAVDAHGAHGAHATLFGYDVHAAMMVISGLIAVTGILAAAYFHWLNREAADRVAAANAGLVRLLANKYYVDEFNDKTIVKPLHTIGGVFFALDRLVIDGLVGLVGFLPRAVGQVIRPAQSGVLQRYGLGMAAGVAGLILLLVAMRG